jgi:hypothetical protein
MSSNIVDVGRQKLTSWWTYENIMKPLYSQILLLLDHKQLLIDEE